MKYITFAVSSLFKKKKLNNKKLTLRGTVEFILRFTLFYIGSKR